MLMRLISRQLGLLFFSMIILGLFFSCQNNENPEISVPVTDWESLTVKDLALDSLFFGKTYLPVYSHIYHCYDNQVFDLTITVSIRNVSMSDSIFIMTADYYDTDGDNIRQYIKNPVCLKPMETVEIIIVEDDTDGGSGANFMFEWGIKDGENPPLFEAVMISTYGQQGLSFTTRGVNVND